MNTLIRKPARIIAVAALVLALAFALFVYPAPLNRVQPHFGGTCRSVPLAAGVPDISVDEARGVAYLAYLDRAPPGDRKSPRGTVMLVDLNVSEPHVRAALLSDPADFQPVGLSLYAPAEGVRRLFVISRGAGKSPGSVEVFEQSSSGTFSLLKILSDSLLVHPTAIVAVGPEQFYVTNDPVAPRGPGRLWALLERPSSSTVLYYDGTRMSTAVTGLQMASGLATSPDGGTVYVSELAGKRVQIFDRELNNGSLHARDIVVVDSAPTHLTSDAAGNVWIAAQPRLLAAYRNLDDATRRAPSQVLKLSPDASGDARVSEIYLDGGEQLSAAGVAAARGKRLIVGSSADHKLLVCDTDH